MFTAITLTQFMLKSLIASNLFKNYKLYGVSAADVADAAKEGKVNKK